MLVQLCDYCHSVIQATDEYKRHLQLVFFIFSYHPQRFPSFPEIILDLRASHRFELFGMGSPCRESPAALLEALATWYSQHQRMVCLSPVAGPPSDHPLRHHHHTTPQLSQRGQLTMVQQH